MPHQQTLSQTQIKLLLGEETLPMLQEYLTLQNSLHEKISSIDEKVLRTLFPRKDRQKIFFSCEGKYILRNQTKKELLKQALDLGLDIDEKATKKELREVIENHSSFGDSISKQEISIPKIGK